MLSTPALKAFSRSLAWSLFSCASFLTPPASAAWLEASSNHFIVYSDTSEAQLRDFTSRLEHFDYALRKVFLWNAAEDNGRRSNRLKIYVLPSQTAIEGLCGCINIAGFYVSDTDAPVAFTPRRMGDESQTNLNSQIILFHEYAHHFMFSNAAAAYPTWYSEGFAEFASTAKIERDGRVDLGGPAAHRTDSLQGNVLSMQALLDSSARHIDREEAVSSSGWLLTHYLLFNASRSGQLKKYLDAINNGTPSVDAGKAAFGDLKTLDLELAQYLENRRLKYLAIDSAPIGDINIRPLSVGASAMMPIEIRVSRGLSRKSALELLPEALRLAVPFPNDPDVQAQLAAAEYHAGNAAAAEAAADRALQADPKCMEALIYKGRIGVNQATETHADEQAWKLARTWYAKANRVDSNAALPLFLFYSSFIREGIDPTANAVAGLNRAFELAPENFNMRMTVAYQALKEGHADSARRLLAPIAFSPHGGGLGRVAGDIIALIDTGKTDEALRLYHFKKKDEDSEDQK